VAETISCWAVRYLDRSGLRDAAQETDGVLVTESGEGRFQQLVLAGPHSLLADEPTSVGGDGSGPTPYDLLSAALGACTSMTLRMYAERKKMDLGKISVLVTHSKSHAADCADCVEGRAAQSSRFSRVISVAGEPSDESKRRLLEIADRCPVHRTLSESSLVSTTFGGMDL